MGKVTHNENWRVEVRPREPLFFLGDGDKAWRNLCESIVSDIKRHVDDVGDISIEHDTVALCEHCGWAWTERSDTYNGGCCDEDEKNNPDTEQEL